MFGRIANALRLVRRGITAALQTMHLIEQDTMIFCECSDDLFDDDGFLCECYHISCDCEHDDPNCKDADCECDHSPCYCHI